MQTVKSIYLRKINNIICILFIFLLIPGCANYNKLSYEEKLYLALNDYSNLQKIALQYKKSCNNLQTINCKNTLKEIQNIDKKIIPIIKEIDIENIKLGNNLEVISGLLLEFKNTLEINTIKNILENE